MYLLLNTFDIRAEAGALAETQDVGRREKAAMVTSKSQQ